MKLRIPILFLIVVTLVLQLGFIPSAKVSAKDSDGCEIVDNVNGACLDDFYTANDLWVDTTIPVCSGSDNAVTELLGENNESRIWNYLTARGLSATQAAGIMGNLKTESAGSWSPTVNEYGQTFGEGGYGIAQWTHDPGRRGNLVAYLRDKHSGLMAKYYNENYSTADSSTTAEEGFIPKNSLTGTPIPKEDNNQLLLAELNFLYDESNSRMLSKSAADKGLGTTENTEWDAIKGTTTVQDASDIWLYSFEIPADIDAASVARKTAGEVIYNAYSVNTECPENSKKQLAQQIIDSGNLYYDGLILPVEKEIIPNIASGKNNGNDWPCGMNILILQGLAAITKEHRIRANSLNRACSDDLPPGSGAWSRHYAGNGSAIDFGPIDGIASYSQTGAQRIVDLMAPYLLPGATVGQAYDDGVACVPNLSVPTGTRRINDFCTHLHVDVQPNGDPDLRCKIPISYGGCDESQRI